MGRGDEEGAASGEGKMLGRAAALLVVREQVGEWSTECAEQRSCVRSVEQEQRRLG